MFGLLKKQPLLEEQTVQWMFDNFNWALRHFDAEVFYKETILVVPSNELFPGSANNAEDMASLIFERVKSYAGLAHWPCRLLNEEEVTTIEPPKLILTGPVRGSKGIVPVDVDETHRLVITYNPFALNDPEVMIANYAHILSHYLGSLSSEVPPGGTENWPHVTELLAVFLGFGVIMANTAHTAKIRSCGSCSGPAVERTNYLSQEEVTYALAVFTCVRQIPNNQVLRYLKKSLHPFFKKAVKDVMGRDNALAELRSFSSSLPN